MSNFRRSVWADGGSCLDQGITRSDGAGFSATDDSGPSQDKSCSTLEGCVRTREKFALVPCCRSLDEAPAGTTPKADEIPKTPGSSNWSIPPRAVSNFDRNVP